MGKLKSVFKDGTRRYRVLAGTDADFQQKVNLAMSVLGWATIGGVSVFLVPPGTCIFPTNIDIEQVNEGADTTVVYYAQAMSVPTEHWERSLDELLEEQGISDPAELYMDSIL